MKKLTLLLLIFSILLGCSENPTNSAEQRTIVLNLPGKWIRTWNANNKTFKDTISFGIKTYNSDSAVVTMKNNDFHGYVTNNVFSGLSDDVELHIELYQSNAIDGYWYIPEAGKVTFGATKLQ